MNGTMLGLPAPISVALFDLDGVLTDTAVLHKRAWKQAFDAFIRERDGDEFVPSTDRDYLLVLASLKRCGDVGSYPGSVRYLTASREAGLRVGVVTSSERRHLRRPDPFLACAQTLAVAPRCAAVFEDALSGLQAGRAGGFGYLVGVDRVGGDGHAAAMRAVGADVVVTDLAELLAA